MFTKMARHQTRLSVIASARASTDDECDLLSGVNSSTDCATALPAVKSAAAAAKKRAIWLIERLIHLCSHWPETSGNAGSTPRSP